jgi:hypothetical protein
VNIVNAIRSRLNAYLRGWKTTQKIVVIESDDWGSIRTSSRTAYEDLVDNGYPMDRSCYSFDALETSEDLELLFEVLNSVRDCTGRPACLTANMVMANPDFEKIRDSGYQNYYYKPVSSMLAELPDRENVADLWRVGFHKRLFIPQFHVREHVCWWQWLKALRDQETEAVETFRLGMCGVPFASSKKSKSFFTPLFVDADILLGNGVDQGIMIREGVALFEDHFEFKSLSTVAPNLTWTDETELNWASLGIRYIQGGLMQNLNQSQQKKRLHFLGERSMSQGYYLVRNCKFEPSALPKRGRHWIRCLLEANLSFALGKPAIISSHRVNFIGSINSANRSSGLRQLSYLLHAICNRWPDVYFLSTPELGYMIENGINRVEDLPESENYYFPGISSGPTVAGNSNSYPN